MWQLLIPALTSLIDKIIPDPQAAAEAKLKALAMAQAGDFKEIDAALQLAKGQTDTNIEEAKSDSLFKSGWRPAVGWTCVSGLFYDFILRPLLPWAVEVLGKQVPPLPQIDVQSLLVLLFGILGLGAYRTFEKIKGA